MAKSESVTGASSKAKRGQLRALIALSALAGAGGIASCHSDEGGASDAINGGRAGIESARAGSEAAGSLQSGAAGSNAETAATAGTGCFDDDCAGTGGVSDGGDRDGNGGSSGHNNAGDSGGIGAITGNRQRWLTYFANPDGAGDAVYLLDLLSAGYPRTLLSDVRGVAFSPDGHWLADTTASTLELLDISGASLGKKATVATGTIGHSSWSKDSQWLAFESGTSDLWLYQVATGATFQLSDNAMLGDPGVDFITSRWGERAVFTNAGNNFYFVNLANVSATTPPVPIFLTNLGFYTSAASNRTGWIGDEYYVLDSFAGSLQNHYAQFNAAGFESLRAIGRTVPLDSGPPLVGGVISLGYRNPSPPMGVVSPSAGSAPQAWFRLDTAQVVEWPSHSPSPSPFLAYAPDCSRFALQTDTSTVQIFNSPQPNGPAIASLPVAGVLPTSENYVWAPDGQLLASQWTDQVRVTSFSPALATETVPGASFPTEPSSSSNILLGNYAFGVQRNWVSFESAIRGDGGSIAPQYFRWFSVLSGSAPQSGQKFPTTSASLPSESPDHTQVALLSDAGLAVTTLSHGTFGPLRTLIPLSRDELSSAAQLSWSADSTHLAMTTNTSNTNYTLKVVDALAADPTSISIPIVNRAYSIQP